MLGCRGDILNCYSYGGKKVQDYTENVRKNKPKTTKPQSEKSKLTPSNIVKPKQKRQKD
jgi:hypothetical protein